jgi:hypothetical protein
VSRGDSHQAKGGGAIALALTALLLAVGALLPSGAIAATGSVSGTVSDTSSQPIEGIAVYAVFVGEGEPAEGQRGGYAVTGSDGGYTISNLALGEYKVVFFGESQGYISEYFDDKRSFAEATILTVESSGLTGIDAELELGARIEGVVRAAATSAPVPGATACALDAETGALATYCAEAAADGTYEIGGLRAGDYKVEFSAGSSGQPLLPQFYDHKAAFAEAATLHLEAAAAKGGVDADLQAEPVPPAPVEARPTFSAVPPFFTAPLDNAQPVRHRACRKGLKKRKVKGKVRCVKPRQHRHRRHHHHLAPSRAARASLGL